MKYDLKDWTNLVQKTNCPQCGSLWIRKIKYENVWDDGSTDYYYEYKCEDCECEFI